MKYNFLACGMVVAILNTSFLLCVHGAHVTLQEHTPLAATPVTTYHTSPALHTVPSSGVSAAAPAPATVPTHPDAAPPTRREQFIIDMHVHEDDVRIIDETRRSRCFRFCSWLCRSNPPTDVRAGALETYAAYESRRATAWGKITTLSNYRCLVVGGSVIDYMALACTAGGTALATIAAALPTDSPAKMPVTIAAAVTTAGGLCFTTAVTRFRTQLAEANVGLKDKVSDQDTKLQAKERTLGDSKEQLAGAAAEMSTLIPLIRSGVFERRTQMAVEAEVELCKGDGGGVAHATAAPAARTAAFSLRNVREETADRLDRRVAALRQFLDENR